MRRTGDRAADDRIRVMYVVDNLSFRGGERTFLQLATGLDRARFRPEVACSPGGVFVERLREIDVPVIAAPMRNRWRLDTALRLARELRRRRPHIVHTQGRGDPFGRIAGRLARVPAIVSTTAMIAGRYRVEALWRKILYRLIDRVTDHLVDRYIVVNRDSVDVLAGRHRVPRERIAVIPNGIELDRYVPDATGGRAWRERLGVPEGATLVGALGRLTWQKGFDDLIRAFPTLADDGVWLAIGGEGDDRAELEGLARNLGLDDQCLFPGFVDDVPGFLKALDVFVLPSRIEGHPMVLLEAMAMAKPVVATDIAGVGDMIADGFDGRLVPPGDIVALMQALLQVCDDLNAARRLGRNARKKIEREYTVERMVRRTEALYEGLLEPARDAPGEAV